MLTEILRKNKLFFIPWLVLLVLGFVLLMFNGKGDGVLWLNRLHNNFADVFFSKTTQFGEYIGLLGVLVILLLFKDMRHVLAYIFLLLVVLLAITLLKEFVFPRADRPIIFLEEENLRLVDGMFINRRHSFPSGHTTAAFAYFGFLALSLPSRGLTLICLFLATMVAVSRIYLVQHFLMDVVAGSVLGVVLATLVYLFLVYKRPWANKKWLDVKLRG